MKHLRKSLVLVLSAMVIYVTPLTANAATLNPQYKPCVAGGCYRERSETNGSVYCEHHECHAEGCKHRALVGEEYCEQHLLAK